ncbi:hypothetical protein GYMLUDRAFT_99016 [Collybiopsis luxurians FD-317 M1]|uniref:Utp14-domain-containing protein n=1 Tax=Collybiopsis luxurians FD-317 M1 TaxID=944289 RepID=A0A0D0CNK3_9AGAR|nr:hypothetical protein GYMLUDRAFT_99016 [Collybiopsis luxurians FD-317 M1]
MARPSSGSRPKSLKAKDASKRKSAAAAGYAKRHAKKAANSLSRSQDVYEYTPEKVRRSKIGLDLDRDEEMDGGARPGYGNDDDEEMEDIRMKARLIGENGEDEKIDSEDDEEIDSDAAFDEDDDERFAGFFSKKVEKKKAKKRASVRFADVDLDEDDEPEREAQNSEQDESEEEDQEESGEDDEFIDVLDILDGRGEPLNSDDETKDTRKESISADRGSDDGMKDVDVQQEAEEEEEDEDEEADEEDDKISVSLSEAENEAAGALDDLQSFISSLDPSSSSAKKRKADGEEPEQPKKRRLLKERTEAGVESEFRTQSAGLSLNDLLAPLGQTSSLDKSVKALQSASVADGSSSGKKKKPQTLPVPLPQRTQERVDRQAAYEQTKAEVDKWSATMKRISEAEHLSFPLQAPAQARVSNLELAAKFKPTTALESTISSLLSSANLATDASVLETEENILKTNAISVEEVAERRRELRRMRELMFRAEAKAKRVKKIKSKVYRRLRRKEREGVDEGGDDGEEGEGLSEERKLKLEMERARERATLKHKNTGKWAKKMMSRNGFGEGEDGEDDMRGGRQEIEEMLLRGEKLRRKIQGKDSDEDESSGDEDDDGDDDGDEGGVESAFNELKALSGQVDDSEESFRKKGKSVFEMKFMKDAMARKQAETSRMVDDFVKEMGAGDEQGDDEGDDEGETLPENGVVVSRTGGRMVFKPGATTGKGASAVNISQTLSRASEDTSSSTLKSTDALSPPSPASPLVPLTTQMPSRPLEPSTSEPASSSTAVSSANPWLVPSTSTNTGKTSRKNEIVVDKDSSSTTKSKHKLKKQTRKTEEEKAKAKDDAVVEIEMDEVLVAPSSAGAATSAANSGANASQKSKKDKGKGKGKGKDKGKVQVSSDGDDDQDSDSDNNSEVEAQEKMLQLKGKKAKTVKAFEQRELVARAFAGDNVVRDFEEAKRREIAMDAPKEVDTTLPGWGSWGGTGTRKSAPKPHLIKKVAGIDPKTREDYNKSRVIISEKRDKKAAKYLVNDLPYPYTSKAQFDRRMQQPLGPEWNTRVGFQKGTLPRIVKKMGTVIDPLEKLS